MCLAVPGLVKSVTDDGGPMARRGRVDFAGIVKECNLSVVPDAAPGDYVLVHAGIAIQRIDRAEAEKTLGYFREMGELEIAAAYTQGEGSLVERAGHTLTGKIADLYELLSAERDDEDAVH